MWRWVCWVLAAWNSCALSMVQCPTNCHETLRSTPFDPLPQHMMSATPSHPAQRQDRGEAKVVHLLLDVGGLGGMALRVHPLGDISQGPLPPRLHRVARESGVLREARWHGKRQGGCAWPRTQGPALHDTARTPPPTMPSPRHQAPRLECALQEDVVLQADAGPVLLIPGCHLAHRRQRARQLRGPAAAGQRSAAGVGACVSGVSGSCGVAATGGHVK